MTDKGLWQAGVGKAWAQSWQRTDRSFAGLTARFLDLLESLPGRTVLDIGCGAGELSLALARRWPEARIIGVDVSPDLVETAQARAGDNPQTEFELGDAAMWTKPGFAPDLLVSRHGVMFFDDPIAAFSHLFKLAAASARLAFTCFPPASFMASMQGLRVFSIRSMTSFSRSARLIALTRCFGPVASAVMNGRFTSVEADDDSSIFAFSAASFRR